jgi:CRISPR-associated protein Cst1
MDTAGCIDKIKIYTKDWYFNASIVGFLKVLCDGDFEKLKKSNSGVIIDENFVEFNIQSLDDFESKFYKQLFLNFFNKKQYLAYIDKSLKQRKKDGTINLASALKIINNFPFKDLYPLIYEEKLNCEESFSKFKEIVEGLTEEKIYEKIKETDYFENYFLEKIVRWLIAGPSNVKNILVSINQRDYLPKKKDKVCLSCQERKAEFDVTNAISNVIGFNKDNSNWVWGYNTNKIKFCSICSLIYLCASTSLIYMYRNNAAYFYFVNHNASIDSLINSYIQFKFELSNEEKKSSVYTIMVKETVKFLVSTQAEKKLKNISFIEIKENNFGGRSSKSYNVYSFNISYNLASFINSNMQSIPRGYYKINDSYFDIEEEILRSTVSQTLCYNDLDKYLRIFLQQQGFFNVSQLVNYVLQYILQGDKTMDLLKISKKGFINGRELREKFKYEKKENQIMGLAYQFLNDLKVADRDKFLDKYLRVSMSNGLESRFGQDELNSKDAFLQFGYSFIAGLINDKKEKGDKDGDE